jgi:hypothetical protein
MFAGYPPAEDGDVKVNVLGLGDVGDNEMFIPHVLFDRSNRTTTNINLFRTIVRSLKFKICFEI